jgi:outer membrane protein assembly factor BamD
MKRFFLMALFIGLAILAISCSRGGVRDTLPPHEQFQKAMGLYDEEEYLKAQGELQRLVYSYPGQPFIDTAQFYLAMAFYQDKSFPEAVGEFKRLLQAYPSSPFADDAQYYVGMSHYKESPGYAKDQNETYAAVDEFGIFLDRFPSSPFAEDVRTKLDVLYDKLAKKLLKSGQLYLKLNDYEPALIYFQQVRENYAETEWAIEARYYAGEAQLKLGRKSDALETFQSFVAEFPDHKLVKKAREQIDKLGSAQAGG